jgi:TfoX/Sxy family transcriptional regulator of competence genes
MQQLSHCKHLERVTMASDAHFVDYVLEQMQGAGSFTHRKMFGEYAIYCNQKVVALVCDNQLFVKITVQGQTFIDKACQPVLLAPPYPSAKDWFLIQDQLDDREWLVQLIRITADALPIPKLVRY